MSTLVSIPRSVSWNGDSISLLSQTKLPTEVEYKTLVNITDVWESIVALEVRGAPAIGITAAFGLALSAKRYETDDIHQFLTNLQKDKDYLASSRPTAVNLFWALNRVAASVDTTLTVKEAKERIEKEALSIQEEDEQVCRTIGELALTLLAEDASVLTICNAGSIATARYGTALAPLYIGKEKGLDFKVFASETRPVLQGARLTTWELQQAGVDVTLITDNMAANTIQTKGISAIIVGADRIVANGDTANKIGTFNLAILAKHFNIPFYVAAPLSTFDPNLETGKEIVIEERNEAEVTHVHGVRVAPEGISVYNPAFDVTPNELITAIITEKGILKGNYKEEIQKLFF